MKVNQGHIGFECINRPEGRYAMLFDTEKFPHPTEHQFSPSGYDDAQSVSGQGGRGGAWYVQTYAGPAVLKHYYRGGFLSKFVHKQYFFLGNERTRSFQEFNMLLKLSELGLPVPKPLVAFCKRGLFSYQAALLTVCLLDVRSLATAAQLADAPWQRVGEVLARFHRAGAHHSDLNANNILINQRGDIFIIDWDKCKLEQRTGPWCMKVLARLQRSLLKECVNGNQQQLQQGISQMMQSYQQAMK
ncbi:MAG: 3-deoxy-D-manno-octulosonic acid kinase [Arenimonas sp.]|nr:3-deoxy-D-manno-octulosonic acid kinase [Arenimonas sp.]